MSNSERNLEGIRGWLVLIFIGLVITPIRIGLFLFQEYTALFKHGNWNVLTSPSSEFYHHLWAPLLVFESVGNLLLLILSLTVLYFFLHKSKYVPKLIIFWLTYGLIFVIIDFFFAEQIPLIADLSQDTESTKEVIRSFIAALIWIPYFLISKRVKATFIH
ncbi:DUF2569 domain-containing protein [Alkanindiges illinoisensis]|uniref:DUF2569 domain-containing protein n=1 Tax=Alkanindiges illinoisensis TaxID=197183 RepID=UPI00047ADDDD|nr:DUF2569 domain-containing protein [Alkanindiges illinoisensis]